MTASISVPRALTDAEVGRYHAEGFLVIDGIFSAEEVERWRGLVEADAVTSAYRRGDATLHAVGLTERHPAFLALARDPRLIALLEPLIGPDIVLMHSKLAAKPLRAGLGEFPWHQDGAYYPHTNTDVPALMVMLDDATPANGAMRMVRCSHRLGYLDHDDEEGFFSGACRRELWNERPHSVVDVTPGAGGVSIHHPLMLHGSPPSRSGLPRRGLAFPRAADALQLGDEVWGETGLVIAGAARGTVRCDPLPIRLPRFRPGTRGGEHGSAWHQVGGFARAQNRAAGLSEIGTRSG
jgi:ectoine hydroxylase-related dioxygenase (phytanoyl-CoA dioxygenase family)